MEPSWCLGIYLPVFLTPVAVNSLAQEASKVFAKLLYEFMFAMAKEVKKPISDITLVDLFTVVQKKTSES